MSSDHKPRNYIDIAFNVFIVLMAIAAIYMAVHLTYLGMVQPT